MKLQEKILWKCKKNSNHMDIDLINIYLLKNLYISLFFIKLII